MSTVQEQSEQRPEPVESAPGATTMCEAFLATAERYVAEIALRTPGGEVELTFGAYRERAARIAAALAGAGVGRGDTVALLMANRPEFHLCDTAAMLLGATPFSVYATSSPEQIAYLFENSGAKVIFAEAAFEERLPPGPRVVRVEELEAFEATGAADFDVDAAAAAVQGDDVLTLIYTSGTTGPPKGVETTHANMLAQCRGVAKQLPMRPGARITSYLPSAHIADRWSSHYNQMVYGLQVTCVPDARAVAAALPEVRPTVWGAVPRVLEKLKAALEAGIAAEPDDATRAAIQGAIATGIEKVRLEQAGEPVPADLAERHAALDAAVLSKLRAKIGLDQVEWLIVGAAPMAREVQEFLMGLGLPITEIYGMSEASCCVTMVHPSRAKIGSVGPALDGVQLRLADDGELLIKGPTVTRGYRNDPERTAEAVDAEGWLHTGDICTLDDDGFVRIVDRKKELIISAGGKNMSPANIEGTVKTAHPLIGQIAVIGDRRPYNVALIVLEPESGADANDPAVREQIAAAVDAANQKLARVEQIKRFALLDDEWLPGGDELTPTMKLKRRPIAEKYAEVIESLYA